jgi:hypothetical protein
MKSKTLEYLKIENDFFRDLKGRLGKDLLFYCLVGSLGRKDIVVGWSDIDILLIVRSYNHKILKDINSALSGNSTEVKIGITVYTPKEFMTRRDPKTLHYIKSILKEVYRPRIAKKAIEILIPGKQILQLFDLVDYTKHLHVLKRELLLGRDYNEKKVYKTVIAIIKIMLRSKGVMEFYGYDDVLKKTKIHLGDFGFKDPGLIVKSNKLKNVRYDDYVKFLAWSVDFDLGYMLK